MASPFSPRQTKAKDQNGNHAKRPEGLEPIFPELEVREIDEGVGLSLFAAVSEGMNRIEVIG